MYQDVFHGLFYSPSPLCTTFSLQPLHLSAWILDLQVDGWHGSQLQVREKG